MPSDQYAKRQSGGVAYSHDLMSEEPLPFSDSSVDAFYCSHVIEHLNDAAVARLLMEAKRSLKPGGVLRITCPDLERIHDAYKRGDEYFFTRFAFRKAFPNLTLAQAFLHCFAYARTTHARARIAPALFDGDVARLFDENPLAEACDIIVKEIDSKESNRRFPQNHVNWWTLDKLERFAEKAGFSSFVRQQYNCTVTAEMADPRSFDKTKPFMSLYADLIC